MPVYITGLKQAQAHLARVQAQIIREQDRATRSAANVVRRAVRAEARKLRGAGRVVGVTATGRVRVKHDLESSVQVTPVAGGYSVGPRTPLAHLVIKGVAPHGLISGRAMPITAAGGSIMFRGATTVHTTPRPFVDDALTSLTRAEVVAAAHVTLAGGPVASDT